MAGRDMGRIFKIAVLIGGILLLATCENALLGTVRVMVEESTSPLQVGFQPEPGTYTLPQSIQLSANKDGATIRYTTDGGDPTAATGTVYAGPIAVGASTTLRARAFKELYSDSMIADGAYTIPFGGQTKKFALTPEADAQFGAGVAIDGDYTIVGAPFKTWTISIRIGAPPTFSTAQDPTPGTLA